MQAVTETTKPTAPPIHDQLHIWSGLSNAEDANAWVEHHLAAARSCIAQLVAVTAPRTIENTLVPYDRACWHLRMAGSQSGVMFMVHPLADVRDAAQQLSQVIGAEAVALSLNRDVYQALAALNASLTEAPPPPTPPRSTTSTAPSSATASPASTKTSPPATASAPSPTA